MASFQRNDHDTLLLTTGVYIYIQRIDVVETCSCYNPHVCDSHAGAGGQRVRRRLMQRLYGWFALSNPGLEESESQGLLVALLKAGKEKDFFLQRPGARVFLGWPFMFPKAFLCFIGKARTFRAPSWC